MILRRNNSITFHQTLVLVMLFLGSMNLMNKYFYFIFIAFLAFFLLNGQILKVDAVFGSLLVLSLSYLLFYPPARDGITTAMKQFSYPMCYFIGLNFFNLDRNGPMATEVTEKKISAALIVLTLGAFTHYLLNMVSNMGSVSRNTVDIWTKEIIGATGQAALAVMATGVFAALLFSEKKPFVKLIAAAGIIMILLYNLVLAGRTLIVLTALVLMAAIVYRIIHSDIERKFQTIISVIVVVAAIIVIYVYDIWGVRSAVLSSNLSARFNQMLVSDDSRMAAKLGFIKNMLRYPFGGGNIRRVTGHYAHELYLDIYSDTGIVGYVATIYAVIITLKRLNAVLKNANAESDTKLLQLCFYIALLAEFFVEPIVQGIPWMFCAFCFSSGLLGSYISCLNQSRNYIICDSEQRYKNEFS